MLKKYFKKYFFHYVFGLLSIVVIDVIALRIPVITGLITDGLEQGTMDKSDILRQMGWLVLVGISITLLRVVWRVLIFGTARKVEYGLRNDFFAHLEILSTSFYNKQKTGDLMAYATNDLNAIRMLVGPGILMLLDTVVITSIVVYQMISTTDVTLTILAVMPMPIIAFLSLKLGHIIRFRYDKKQEAFAHLSDLVQENISGIRVVKAFVQESYELIRFSQVNEDNFEKNMSVVKVQAIMFPLAMLITGVSITIALGYGGRLTMLGTITLGEFVAFIQYIMMLIWPMFAFGWFINIYSSGMASLKRFEEIMNSVPEIKDNEETDSSLTLEGDIVLKDLTFRYPEAESDALSKISLHIKKGDHIGIVGRTGSGKTTLVNLLLRLFDTDDGTLMIDGKSIKEWPLKNLRNGMGYVPQDNFLFSDSIKNNIGFGLDDFSHELIEETAKNVDVHSNIIEFEDQYETIIGERGVTLSGGQKQRVSIARALIKDPAVLILDDAVSAVDTKTEESILSHLREVRLHKTTITIAHRISTVKDCSCIYVLDEGRLVESGQHEDLVAIKGIYYGMVMKQQLEKSIAEEE